MPIYNFQLKARKPINKPYPKELASYGDHLRKKRFNLNLSQSQVAKLINVTTDTITNWELNRVTPNISYIPKIISFLEYSPEIEVNPIKAYRINKGLTQKEMAKILQIDPTTLSKIELGKTKIMCKVREILNRLFV